MKPVHLFARLLAVFTLAMSSAAFAQTPPAAPAQAPQTPLPAASQAAETTSSSYVLGRDDVVEIGLLGSGGFGGRARVQADGTIQLQLIGKVVAADLTTADLAAQIRTALMKGGFYADPVVAVEVVSYASRYVTVLGSVGQPGLVPMNRPYRISEVLARVGGVREGAADYIVIRSEKGGEKRLMIRDLATGDLNQDPFVAPGDKIYAPVAETFYVSGQVKAPGGFPIVSNMTVQMAIARAGGLTDSGSDKGIELNRGGKKTKVTLTDKVEPGDVLVIKERLF